MVDRFAVLDGIENESVLRGVGGIEAQAPSEDEIMGRDRLPVAPARIGAQPEGGAGLINPPMLRHPRRQLAPWVEAQQALHDVAEHQAADLIGGAGAVQLRRLLREHHGDGVVGGVHRRGRAACGGGEARQQVQAPHQGRQPNQGGQAEQPQLPGR